MRFPALPVSAAPPMPTAFDHLAIALDELSSALPFVVGELGGRFCDGGDAGSFRWRQYRFAGGGLLELIEPAGEPGGFLHRFIASSGAGVHHVTFEVDDLAARCARAIELGFDVVGVDDARPGWQEAFLHPRTAGGTVVQLVAARETADSRVELPQPPGDDPDPGPPVVSLTGLRMGYRDISSARRLWCDLLEGEAPAGAHARVGWPGSPMRVSLREGPADGPLAVEVECLHPVLLPQGPHPVLGAEFTPVDPRSEREEVAAVEVEEEDEEDVYFLEEP